MQHNATQYNTTYYKTVQLRVYLHRSTARSMHSSPQIWQFVNHTILNLNNALSVVNHSSPSLPPPKHIHTHTHTHTHIYIYRTDYQYNPRGSTGSVKKKILITHNLRLLKIKTKDYGKGQTLHNFMLEEVIFIFMLMLVALLMLILFGFVSVV